MQTQVIIAQVIMALVPGIAAVLGVVSSLATLRLKSKAEREYLVLLHDQAAALRTLRDRVSHDGVVSSEELKQLIASLDQATQGLPIERRRLISAALHQPSLRGRARYAAKLMNKAGIGSGTLPVATP